MHRWIMFAMGLLAANAQAAETFHCARAGDTAIASNNFLFGGAKDLMSFSDFSDLGNFAADRAAIDWYLHSGITNGGKSWTEFGPTDPLPRWEVIHNLYRFYSIMNERGAPFADVPVLFGTGQDTTKERKFFVAAITLRGAEIIQAEDSQGNFFPDRPITTEEFLEIFYRAINSPESSKANGVAIAAGTRTDLQRYRDAGEVDSKHLAATAGLVRAGCFQPAGELLRPKGSVPRIALVRLLHALRHSPLPKTMNADAERRLSAPVLADGQNLRVRGWSHATDAVNATALYARNGAMVDLDEATLRARGELKAPDFLAYRWGLGGVVLANGYGTSIDIRNTRIDSTGQGAYALYATSGGTIHIRDSEIDGGRAAMVTYNGRILFDNVKIRGTDRTYSSDHFGGTIVYRNVDSEKTAARMGGGGFFLDENTTGEFYDSRLVGEGFLAIVTGIGRAYFKNTTARMGTGIEFTNNTSLLSDIATATLEGGEFSIERGNLFTGKKAQRFVVRVDGAKINLPAGGQLLRLEQNSHARLYLRNLEVTGNISVEPGSSAELYLENARLRGQVSGAVRVIADARSGVSAN